MMVSVDSGFGMMFVSHLKDLIVVHFLGLSINSTISTFNINLFET